MKKSAFSLAVMFVLASPAWGQALEAAPTEPAPGGAITFDPQPVKLKKSHGNPKQFGAMPRIAPIYNVSAFLTASETSTSMGTLTKQASKAKLEYRALNITPQLITEIASAAQADLAAQLAAAGIQTVSLDEIRNHPDGSKLGLTTKPIEKSTMDIRAKKHLVTLGPEGFGANTFSSVVPKVANANAFARMSKDLDAVIVFPHPLLDFVATSGSGDSFFGGKARVEGEVIFSVDAVSKVDAYFSKSGRFMDGFLTMVVTGDIASSEPFATAEEITTSNNNAIQEISNAWGFNMMGNAKLVTGVTIDQAKYKELALSAIRGYNAAIVEEIKAAKGL